MNAPPGMKLYLLLLSWILWCSLHSFLASSSVLRFIERRTGMLVRFYRLLYNIFAAVSLVIPLALSVHLQTQGPMVFSWSGAFGGCRYLLLAVAGGLFIGGIRSYDLSFFAGISQMRTGRCRIEAVNGVVFKTTGVSGLIRHPWYTGGILLVWSLYRDMHVSTVITATIISGYFLVGALLEERRLIREYGMSYRQYCSKVSMLFPLKWLETVLKRNQVK